MGKDSSCEWGPPALEGRMGWGLRTEEGVLVPVGLSGLGLRGVLLNMDEVWFRYRRVPHPCVLRGGRVSTQDRWDLTARTSPQGLLCPRTPKLTPSVVVRSQSKSWLEAGLLAC